MRIDDKQRPRSRVVESSTKPGVSEAQLEADDGKARVRPRSKVT